MRARRSVWSDREVVELLSSFVMAADEVGRLQRGDDAECELFQGFCEDGHYGGRQMPTSTRQGIYAVAPSGRFLASVNSVDPAKVAAMMRTALARFAELGEDERRLSAEQKTGMGTIHRFEERLPTDGLVLVEYVRDLDRPRDDGDWRTTAWNQDQAWFTAEEARAFVPADLAVGATTTLPARLAERLARLHLVDTVRGQSPPLPRDAVQLAEIRSEVTAVAGDRVSLRIDGRTRVVQKGRWIIANRGEPQDHERGVRTDVEGRAVYDRRTGRFVRFDLLCTGERWGATQYNERDRDLQPSAIGFLFELAGPQHPRVAPAYWWEYDLH